MPGSWHAKIRSVNGLHAFFTEHAGEIILTVFFGIRLIFSRKKLAFRFSIFAVFFFLLYVLHRVDTQDIDPFGNLNVSTNVVTLAFLLIYALYVMFFDHD
jgi:hypothetical protein